MFRCAHNAEPSRSRAYSIAKSARCLLFRFQLCEPKGETTMDPQNLFRGYGEYKIKIVRFECEAFLSLDELYAGIEARRKAEGSPLRSAPDDLPAQDLASPAEKPDGPLSIESLLNAYHARRDPGTANTFHESLFNVQRAVVAALAQPASKKD